MSSDTATAERAAAARGDRSKSHLAVRVTRGASGRTHTVLAPSTADHTVDAVPDQPRTYIWHLWPARNWPLTADEEEQFVDDLRVRCRSRRRGKSGTARRTAQRADTTSLLNALRCGLSCDELFEHAPGLSPKLVLSAYEDLDAKRRQSAEAFEQIIEHRTLEALVDWSQQASVLMAVAVRRMTPAGAVPDDEAVAVRIARVLVEVERVRAEAESIEAELADRGAPDAYAVELGRCLYDPYDPALWSDPFYVPQRVGDLVPLRVADLLGERRP